MKYADYAPHLGIFRHFASMRRIYDDLCAERDGRRADRAGFKIREQELKDENNLLRDRLFQRNAVKPLMVEPPKAASDKPIVAGVRSPLDIMADRQNDADIAAQAMNKLHTEFEQQRYIEEANKILAS